MDLTCWAEQGEIMGRKRSKIEERLRLQSQNKRANRGAAGVATASVASAAAASATAGNYFDIKTQKIKHPVLNQKVTLDHMCGITVAVAASATA